LSETSQHTLEETIAMIRNEIVLMHSKSEEVSTRGFDKLVLLLQQQSRQAITINDELKRLQQILEKNKIEYKNKDKK
jgi:hypothetical protein